jgi:hypothetical protein
MGGGPHHCSAGNRDALLRGHCAENNIDATGFMNCLTRKIELAQNRTSSIFDQPIFKKGTAMPRTAIHNPQDR